MSVNEISGPQLQHWLNCAKQKDDANNNKSRQRIREYHILVDEGKLIVMCDGVCVRACVCAFLISEIYILRLFANDLSDSASNRRRYVCWESSHFVSFFAYYFFYRFFYCIFCVYLLISFCYVLKMFEIFKMLNKQFEIIK